MSRQPRDPAGSPPLLSVVVARTGSSTLAPWLEAVAAQTAAPQIDVIVVQAGEDTRTDALRARYGFELLTMEPSALVPALWGAGMAQARGDVVAVTISACVPSPRWLSAIAGAHAQSTDAGIGGVIELSPQAGLVDRAIHLVRYARYLPPHRAGSVEEIAGDNGTYKHAALASLLPDIARDGFWEPEIHRVLRARGERLSIDPAIAVSFSGSHSAAEFSRQRYRHGRTFGRARSRSLGWRTRALRIALAPVVPPLMLMRSLREMTARRRLDGPTLAAVPLALWFLTCWAAGEAAGLGS